MTYQVGFGRQQTLEYLLPLRRKAALKMTTVLNSHQHMFDAPTIKVGEDDLDLYGFMRTLEWIGVALPVRDPNLTNYDLKWMTEIYPFYGTRIPRLGYSNSPWRGVYVSNDVCKLAILASGLKWNMINEKRITVLKVAASLPSIRKNPSHPGTRVFPNCLEVRK